MNKLISTLLFLFFTVIAIAQVPVISSFSPLSGNIGSTVTITGSNFDASPANNIVYFGASRAIVSAASATSLDVLVPGGAGYGNISVTVNGLTAYSSLKFPTSFQGGELGPTAFESTWGFGNVGAVATSWDFADLDGDGKPEFGVYENGMNLPDGDTIAIYRNTSTNGIISYGQKFKIPLPAPEDVNRIIFKDADGDGKSDLFAFPQGGYWNVYRNTSTAGSLSFAPKVPISVDVPQNVLWGDFDGDGRTDIGLCHGTLDILLNTSSVGNISFNTTPAYTAYSVSNATATDIDEDGKTDLVVVTGNILHVMRNTSSGAGSTSFTSMDLPLLSEPSGLFIGDLDGDHKEDIILISNGSFSIFRNSSVPGATYFIARDDRTINNYNYNFYDVDGDTKPDIVGGHVGQNWNADSIGIFKNTSTTGNISFNDYVPYRSSPFMSIGSMLAGFADLDADGKSEILTFLGADFTTSLGCLKNRAGEPRIIDFTPTNGVAGTVINITGYNLGSTNAVTIGGIPVSSFTVINTNTVSAVTAVGSAGMVVLTTPYGIDSVASFNTPFISSFLPISAGPGATSQTSTVTIKGKNLSSVSAVSFGGVPAASFTLISDTLMTATVSDTGSTGSLAVTGPYGIATRAGFYFAGASITELCPPAASITFDAFAGFTYYKWQVRSGNTAFIDVSDDINYNGSNTPTLHLTNIPSFWNGNIYRFLVSNSPNYWSSFSSPIYMIKFTDRWIGSVSSAWEDPANWSCGTVPDAGTDVIINSGAVVTLNSNTTIRSLSISPGATLTIAAGVNLTILH